VVHLAAKEILAEKIRALIIRGKGRDVFDLWYLLSKRIVIDWNLVNLKMSFYDKKTDVKELTNIIKGISDKEIKKDLTKFLPLNQRTTVAKVKIWLMEKLGERK
jgi:predicted nucleotidyltransferase component of viral defense system